MRLTLEADFRGSPALEAEGWPARLLQALADHDLLDPIDACGGDDVGFQSVGDADEIAAWLVDRGHATSELRGDGGRSGPRVILTVRADWVRLLVHQHVEPGDRSAAAAVDRQLTGLALDLPAVFGEGVLGRQFGIAATELGGEGWDPPDDFDVAWDPDEVVRFVSRAFHDTHRLGRPEQARAMCEDDLPEGVRRESHGDLTVVRWVDDLSDVDAVRAGLDRQQAWLADHPA